jgi:hypothetical protein
MIFNSLKPFPASSNLLNIGQPTFPPFFGLFLNVYTYISSSLTTKYCGIESSRSAVAEAREQFGNPEEWELLSLEAVTRGLADLEDSVRAVVNYRVRYIEIELE